MVVVYAGASNADRVFQYPHGARFAVNDRERLTVYAAGADGAVLAVFAPGCWHHADVGEPPSDVNATVTGPFGRSGRGTERGTGGRP